MLKRYIMLTKPGIVIGNGVAALAGFLLAAGRHIHIGLLAAAMAGLCLIVASACVFNNYLDRSIDQKMKRTRKRALAAGTISSAAALSFGLVLGLAGALILGLFTNRLTLLIALFGLFAYVVLYSLGKRLTSWGTVIGSLSGAVPPVVGYTAVANRLDGGALILFLILVFWQMPHFYAIAIYRREEYKAAGLPVLPLVKGVENAKLNIIVYLIGFLLAVAALTFFGYAGYSYLVISLLAGLAWLRLALAGFSSADEDAWARQVFRFSLTVMMILSVALALGNILP